MAKLISFYTVCLCSSCGIFYIISQLLFNKVFETSLSIIDEEFHVPQGLAYCKYEFDTWNSKITTFPGLYIVTALLLGPFHLCSLYWLRFLNLIASTLNLLLLNYYLNIRHFKTVWTNLLTSINLSLLPPLYFFSTVYYTDIISVTFVLLMAINYAKENHLLLSIFGFCAVIMRQTNILWILMFFGQYVLKELFLHSDLKQTKRIIHNNFSLKDLFSLLTQVMKGHIIKKLPIYFWINFFAYISIFISFAVFVFLNEGIVVGDKNAHIATIHFPQLFYFVLFCLIFGFPFVVTEVPSFLKFAWRKKFITVFTFILFFVIIHFNTLEHSYLLADNRHYTFYIWNKFYRKYNWFRYVLIPIYYFGFYALSSKLNVFYNKSFALTYFITTAIILVLQKMIEIRYFLIPYIFLRVQITKLSKWQIVLEFVIFNVINALTFNIFFTKDIYWPDFEEAQKLIW